MNVEQPVPRLRLVVDSKCRLGEGPVWVAREQTLYWVDIKTPLIWAMPWPGGQARHWTPPFRIGAIAPRSCGGFVAATDEGFALIDLVAGSYDLIGDPELHLPGNRFNDGTVDRSGAFWAGTMDDAEAEATGSLYRLDASHEWRTADTAYGVPNGPAFSVDGRTMFHNDSAKQLTYAFDLNEAGVPRARRVVRQFDPDHGFPDGMTVDAEDHLWIAFWDGWCLRRISPEGDIVETIDLPVARPTSCAFGGERLDMLFITSARVGIEPDKLAEQPHAGGLFALRAGVSGVADTLFVG